MFFLYLALKSSPSKKGRSALLAHSIGPSAGQILDQNEEGQYELRVASSCPTLDENGNLCTVRCNFDLTVCCKLKFHKHTMQI